MGDAARDFAVQEFSWRSVIDALDQSRGSR
jgi:hypothetical protein